MGIIINRAILKSEDTFPTFAFLTTPKGISTIIKRINKLRRSSLTSAKIFVYCLGMSKKRSSRPTDAELEILNVLWEKEPCTVRCVFEQLQNTQNVGYTTVLKLMQIMTDKNLVTRDVSQRSHLYSTAFSKPDMQKRLLTDLTNRAFGGSVQQLAMQVFANHSLSEEELEAIHKLIQSTKEPES